MEETEHEDQKSRIMRRYKALRYHSELWISDFHAHYGILLNADKGLLYLVAQSALIDIDRYKDHHLSGSDAHAPPISRLSDEVKRAAYFLKWLRKLQPLSLSEEALSQQSDRDFAVNKQQYATLANIGFAISYAMNCLADKREAPEKIILTQALATEMIYNLTYREISGDALILKMQMIQADAMGISLTRK